MLVQKDHYIQIQQGLIITTMVMLVEILNDLVQNRMVEFHLMYINLKEM